MKLKNINNFLIAGLVCCGSATTLTSCDDLIDPALENNQEL